jgi:hypothetical protein
LWLDRWHLFIHLFTVSQERLSLDSIVSAFRSEKIQASCMHFHLRIRQSILFSLLLAILWKWEAQTSFWWVSVSGILNSLSRRLFGIHFQLKVWVRMIIRSSLHMRLQILTVHLGGSLAIWCNR